MTTKAGHSRPASIVMILFWFYFGGLSDRIIRKKVTGDWSQSTSLWAKSADDKLMIFLLFFPDNRLFHANCLLES